MLISAKAIVSNSDVIKNYKDCREKSEKFGKIFILKNNQPDAVLFSIDEYERMSCFIEYLEKLEGVDINIFFESMLNEGNKITKSISHINAHALI